MSKRYPLVSPNVQGFLHGADYNPEQWQAYPDVLEEDIRLMKLAGCNVMSVGIFSWVSLEPEEGRYTFEWLDRVLHTLADNGIRVFLATPSGARPAWMAAKYPEVLRVGPNRVRNLQGHRHNHCYSSLLYREKVASINRRLAERYGRHRAVIGWHISNEFNGECHCDRCQEEFRVWLENKYETLDNLNHAWWTAFWSHTFTSWKQIESPAPHGETLIHGLNLDWKRFVTDRTVDFCRHEIAPLRTVNPELPVTTNLMGFFEGLNYRKFADVLDFVSWDAYPTWHDPDHVKQGAWCSFNHDLMRSLKGRPFILMESTPSLTNWQDVSKLKRPGMHKLSSLQAVAHGSDSVMYFQWRKSRGSCEKFHGAVIDHSGHEHTRVFRDVAELGRTLQGLSEIAGTGSKAEVALIADWENRWAVKDAQGPRNIGVHYEDTLLQHYRAFWEQGIGVDIIGPEDDFSGYKLLVAPMLYMVSEETGRRIERFTDNGGTFVSTYWSGIVDETDLCHLGGFPGPLRRTLGIWVEETEGLHEEDRNGLVFIASNALGLQGSFESHELCDLLHLEGAESLAVYRDDFYAGRPALTVHSFGQGTAYHLATRVKDAAFYESFYRKLVQDMGIAPALEAELPAGVTAQVRSDGVSDYVFVMNFSWQAQQIALPPGNYIDLETGIAPEPNLQLPVHGVRILKRSSS